MKKTIYLLLFYSIIVSCNNEKEQSVKLDQLFNSRYERKLISSGDNFPDFNPKKDSVDLYLVALHEKITQEHLQKKLAWSDTFLQNKIQLLKSKNCLTDDKNLKPTVFIASNKDGERLYEYSKPLAKKIAESIEAEILNIKKTFLETNLSSKYDFETWSFLILSDVLLDNWQINDLEKEYLGKGDRPERHGKHYYYGIMENIHHPKENFGIYGNQYRSINDSMTLIIYGNNRNLANTKLRKDKLFSDSIMDNAARVSPADYAIFEQMTHEFKPKLIRLLNENTSYIKDVYRKTGYSDEITFEEFFIWWYHFIYTDATNILAANNQLVIPTEGSFYCIIMN